MKSFSRTLLVGFSILLPVVLSLQLAFWLIRTLDRWAGNFILLLFPEAYLFPGLATAVVILTALIIGLTARLPVLADVWKLPGLVLERLPGLNTVYGMIKDFFDLMSGRPFSGQSVVWVKVGENNSRLLGIVTKSGEDSDKGLGGLMNSDEVAVFLPMSYQAGGYTLVLPKDQVESADMEPGEALQLIMSAGLGKGK